MSNIDSNGVDSIQNVTAVRKSCACVLGSVPGKENTQNRHDTENPDHGEPKDQQVLMAHGPSVNPPHAGPRVGNENSGYHSLMDRRNEDRRSEGAAGAARAPVLGLYR